MKNNTYLSKSDFNFFSKVVWNNRFFDNNKETTNGMNKKSATEMFDIASLSAKPMPVTPTGNKNKTNKNNLLTPIFNIF